MAFNPSPMNEICTFCRYECGLAIICPECGASIAARKLEVERKARRNKLFKYFFITAGILMIQPLCIFLLVTSYELNRLDYKFQNMIVFNDITAIMFLSFIVLSIAIPASIYSYKFISLLFIRHSQLYLRKVEVGTLCSIVIFIYSLLMTFIYGLVHFAG